MFGARFNAPRDWMNPGIGVSRAREQGAPADTAERAAELGR